MDLYVYLKDVTISYKHHLLQWQMLRMGENIK